MDPNVQPTYGTTGAWQSHPQVHPQEREARRRAVAAGLVQLASPFLFIGTLYLGLATDIPVGGADPHGYTQIFGFLFSFLLLIPGLALPAIALPLLRKSRRSGAVLLIITAAMWALLFAILASGYPGGIPELAWSRIVTIAVGVLWTAVSGWCIWAGANAFSRFAGR